MAISGIPAAAKISVRDTLSILDKSFLPMADGLSKDLYALWLGSGISFGRMPGLRKVVERVLRFLQERVVAGDENCRFRFALGKVLGLANLSGDEESRTDLDQPIENWPDLDAIARRLIGNYARVLDVAVDDEEADFLMWAGVDVPGTYANVAIEPDAEHLCVALLTLEGVVSDIASANWDGLVEKAVAELSNRTETMAVFVRAEDTRAGMSGPRLYKFHGCAVRARDDAANYRSKLVARQSQINGWALRPENAVIAERLIDMVTTKRTLMVGLSAQDSNIQGVFVAAQTRMAWPWPSPEPACVFSENELGPDQLGLLQNVYPSVYSAATRNVIYGEALIQAYAKPLLLALVLHVLASKLSALAHNAPGTLTLTARQDIVGGLIEVRNTIGQFVENLGHEPFVRELVRQTERALSLFRDGQVFPGSLGTYRPLYRGTVTTALNDPNLAASGLSELATGIGILGLGMRKGHWSLKAAPSSDPKAGALCVDTVNGQTTVFFAATFHAALRLRVHGLAENNDNAVIVHSLEIPPIMSRSPRSSPGRTGKLALREVSIFELANATTDSNTLLDRFREETAL